MNRMTVEMMEYDRIKEELMELAVSEQGRALIQRLQPSVDICQVERWLKETTEAKNLFGRFSGIPLHSLTGVEGILAKIDKDGILGAEELSCISGLLKDGKKLKAFMKEKQHLAPNVSSYALSISELDDVAEELERCIVSGRLDDRASGDLYRVRKQISVIEARIKEKVDGILKSGSMKKYLQDSYASVRNGRYVVPVKSEYRSSVKGDILDSSSTGSTVFIEPEGVKRLQNELADLRIREENEVYKVLAGLTGLIETRKRELSVNIEVTAHYDFLFAKAKFSERLRGNTVKLNDRGYIDIRGGGHPLLGEQAVPLDFIIGGGYRALVITGPNTGGKTVAIKTVGLLTLMVQSGLHVPADAESEFSVFTDILADIGDGQSIQQSLSTFSSHIKNIIGIMECADKNTLVILDELGAGTDPMEGAGLAVAILEAVFKKGATLLATTHHSEIKEFASITEGFENGSMDFDITTLKPLYKLNIGKPGESNALLISLRLGMDRSVVERAHEITYGEKMPGDYHGNHAAPENTAVNEEIKKAHNGNKEIKKHKEEMRKDMQRKNGNRSFKLGDCVYISTLGKTGIVCELENSKGEVGVLYMKKKIKVNRKRLSLHIGAEDLYPENYDMDIVLKTKENRKKNKLMGRKFVKGLVIDHPGSEE